MKASLIKTAGIQDGKQLFAIIDQYGCTAQQIWSTPEQIAKSYPII